MSRLEQITPEEMPDVVRIASRIRDEEQARSDQKQEQKAFVDAAAEMDLPQEYLERAAAELQEHRILSARKRSTTRKNALAALGIVTAAAALWAITHRPPPAAQVYHFAAQQWRLNSNPESSAKVSFENMDGRSGVAVIHVDKFVPGQNGQYFANLDASPLASSFARFKTSSFFVRSGGLPIVRLYLEAGAGERWRSPAVQAASDWQRETIDLTQYEHQYRDGPGGQWHTAGTGDTPGDISTLSFKVGSYMNDAGASGDIAIDDLEFH